MYSAKYVENVIKSNDKIYIDASALMNVDELRVFIENVYGILKEEEKQIIITQMVYMELQKHLVGRNARKRDIVLKVFDVLSQYEDIFSIQIVEHHDVQCNMNRIFADPTLLAELTENKAYSKQLLITNDKRLSHDAYGLNKLESCNGYTIMVCYLNSLGELRKCSCVKEAQKQLVTTESKVIVNEEMNVIPSKEDEKSNLQLNKIIVPVSTFVFGLVIGKYGKQAWNYIKRMA